MSHSEDIQAASKQALTPLFQDIAAIIRQARTQVRQAVNHVMVQSYWQIGRLIVEHEQQGNARAAYGKQQLQELSDGLTASFGKGFDVTNLRNMRRFYNAFPIWETVSLELSWSHYNLLSRLENTKARAWYLTETVQENWSVRSLDRQISRLYYERLLSSQDSAAIETEANQKIEKLEAEDRQLRPKDVLRDPYVFDFLNLPGQHLLESDLEQGLLDNLQSFLLIDLKLGKLGHQDVGQMDSYVRMYDQHHRSDGDNPTIGLILCSQKSEAVVKYSVLTDSEQLFAAKYLPYLPTEAELIHELEQDRLKVQAQLSEINGSK